MMSVTDFTCRTDIDCVATLKNIFKVYKKEYKFCEKHRNVL